MTSQPARAQLLHHFRTEITPKSIRLRKRFLKEHERKKASREAKSLPAAPKKPAVAQARPVFYAVSASRPSGFVRNRSTHASLSIILYKHLRMGKLSIGCAIRSRLLSQVSKTRPQSSS